MVSLIFDSSITGHHSEYISHLIDYIKKNPSVNEYVFVVPESIQDKFPDIVKKTRNLSSIRWDFIRKSDSDVLFSSSLFKRSWQEFSLMNKFAEKHKVSKVLLMYFNVFQLVLIFKRTKYDIEGILFLQFYRMSRKGFANNLKYFRKYMITKMYCYNSLLRTVFILNDEKTVNFLNKEFCTTKFKMLPDPIPPLKPLENFNIYDYYEIDRDTKIFLHIGSLSDRKGTNEILDSISYISKYNQPYITLLLVGKASEEVLISKIQTLVSCNTTNVKIIFDNSFISNELMKSLFNQCDYVLLPYKNPEASSGILGHAISSNKKVIATGSGLLKDIILENKVGLLLKEVSANSIAEAMELMLLSDNNNDDDNFYNHFLEKHTVDEFSKRLVAI